MIYVTKGPFSGENVEMMLKANFQMSGLNVTQLQLAQHYLESCKSRSDLERAGRDIRALGATRPSNVEGMSSKQYAEANKHLIVADYMLQLIKNNYEHVGSKNLIKVVPMGSELAKAVNGSSSIQVSSEDYETTFDQTIREEVFEYTYMRDVLGGEGRTIQMNSRFVTLPYEDEVIQSNWIPPAEYGQAIELADSIALSQVTYEAHKLAAAVRITDETKEDSSVLELAGILRRSLVKSMSNKFNRALLIGDPTAATSAENYAPFAGLASLPANQRSEVSTTGANRGSTSLKRMVGRDILLAAERIDPVARSNGSRSVIGNLSLIISQSAAFDIINDPNFQDVSQVGEAMAAKLQGFSGTYYGIPTVVAPNADLGIGATPSSGQPVAVLVAQENFSVFEQRGIETEFARNAPRQADDYIISARWAMYQTSYGFNKGAGRPAGKIAVCRINQG